MVQKALKYKATMLILKSIFFSIIFYSFVLMSYLSDIYLMVFSVRGRGAENIEKK